MKDVLKIFTRGYRWLFTCSTVLMVISYTVWLGYYGIASHELFKQSRRVCDISLSYNDAVYAACLREALEAYRLEYISIASNATLLAIAPLMVLWALRFGVFLCTSTPKAGNHSSGLSAVSDWRGRIDARRSTRLRSGIS